MQRGELPEQLWTELYFQTVHDPTGRARWHAHDERLLRSTCPIASPQAIGTSRREEVKQLAIRLHRALRQQLPRRGRGGGGARPARHRARGGADRRAYLPGRVPAAIHVGSAPELRARRWQASISAARARIPAAASSRSTGATRRWRCCARQREVRVPLCRYRRARRCCATTIRR